MFPATSVAAKERVLAPGFNVTVQLVTFLAILFCEVLFLALYSKRPWIQAFFPAAFTTAPAPRQLGSL